METNNINLIKVPATYRNTAWESILPKCGHWFSKSAMAFFQGRVLWATLREMAGDNYTFISSEQSPWSERKYTVREVYSDGTIHTLGEYQEHATRAEAIKAQNKFHKEEEDYINSFN